MAAGTGVPGSAIVGSTEPAVATVDGCTVHTSGQTPSSHTISEEIWLLRGGHRRPGLGIAMLAKVIILFCCPKQEKSFLIIEQKIRTVVEETFQ